MIGAVIFDLDGTLIDSAILHFNEFKKTAKQMYGLEFNRGDFDHLYGKSAEEIIKPFLKKHSLNVSNARDFAVKRRENLKKTLETETQIPLLPGVIDLLEKIKLMGLPLALATSNRRNTGELMVEQAGLTKFFPIQVYHEKNLKAKPSPDIFLEAAKQLDISPQECVVFEDSVHGVQAAKKASMKVVAVSTGGHSHAELKILEPDLLIKQLDEFPLTFLKEDQE